MTPRRDTAAFALAAALLGLTALTSTAVRARDAAHPTVVELFQSQGCSSCPPANANLLAIIDRPGILALSFGVTYWDSLGWKDTFASPQYTARQWSYAHGLHHDNVFTPQMVINGRRDGVGVDAKALQTLIAEGDRGVGGPTITLRGGAVRVSAAATAAPADVWLVRYDPRVVLVPIKRGENGGKTLPHRNVVRELSRLGKWQGQAENFAIARAGDPALRTAILVQVPRGGAIIAAATS